MKRRIGTLRQTVSLVFALTTILPLLMFGYTLHRVNGMREVQDQIVFGLAVVMALLGFHILRLVVTRMADALRLASEAAEPGHTPRVSQGKELEMPVIGAIQEFRAVTRPWTTLSSSRTATRSRSAATKP